MQSGFAQARRIRESLDSHGDLTVILDASGAPSSRMRARFIAQTGNVMTIQTHTALGQGMAVSIAGEVETPSGRVPVLGKFTVRSSRLAGIGKYDVEVASEGAPGEPHPIPPQPVDDDVDYYEILQVSRNADADTIRRVFHVLAQRYHPDNRETGNEDKFRQTAEAYATLSDPERRAAHDVRLAAEQKARLKIFDSLESTQGVQAEQRKRLGILRLLYTKRLTDPHIAYMRGRDFVEMLGCPIEHLEFSLWYLRETRLIHRTDNNHFEITHLGVEAFEGTESTYSKRSNLPLPAPARMPA